MQFLPTVAKQLGFSGLLVGTVYTILPISGLIAKPLFGGLADKFRTHKAFFIIFQAVLAVAFFSMNFIPEIVYSAKTNLTCHYVAFLELCSLEPFTQQEIQSMQGAAKDNASCHLSCTLTTVNEVKALCDSWHVDHFCSPILAGFKEGQIEADKTIDFQAQFNESFEIRVNIIPILD